MNEMVEYYFDWSSEVSNFGNLYYLKINERKKKKVENSIKIKLFRILEIFLIVKI